MDVKESLLSSSISFLLCSGFGQLIHLPPALLSWVGELQVPYIQKGWVWIDISLEERLVVLSMDWQGCFIVQLGQGGCLKEKSWLVAPLFGS